jgi:4-hydroxy 2-oxovalerate aldolase
MPKKEKFESAEWVTYRPQIKVCDCTVRDGGLMNDHRFNDDFVRGVYRACVEAGVDYMEFGYRASKKIFDPKQYGPWKFCDEEALRRIVGENKTRLKICVMADAERTDYHEDFIPKNQSVVDCIRVACYAHQIPTAIDMVADAREKGYETTLNLMAVSTVPDFELDKALDVVAQCPVDVVYIVDSYGALYGEQIDDLMDRFSRAIKGKKEIGIHTHNNQQMAFSNTIAAIIRGATRLDATMMGLGRGAGNCHLELLLGFLKNPKYLERAVLKCVQETILPLRKEMDWGYSIPYAITGMLNEHPRDAIKLRESDRRDDYVAFLLGQPNHHHLPLLELLLLLLEFREHLLAGRTGAALHGHRIVANEIVLHVFPFAVGRSHAVAVHASVQQLPQQPALLFVRVAHGDHSRGDHRRREEAGSEPVERNLLRAEHHCREIENFARPDHTQQEDERHELPYRNARERVTSRRDLRIFFRVHPSPPVPFCFDVNRSSHDVRATEFYADSLIWKRTYTAQLTR